MYIQVVYVRNAISMAYEINRNNCFYCVLLTIYSIQLTINDVLYTLYRKIYRILCMSQLHFQISRMFLTAYRILLPLCSYFVVHRQVLSVQKGLCVRVYMSLLYNVCLCGSLCACTQVSVVHTGLFVRVYKSLLYTFSHMRVSLRMHMILCCTYMSLCTFIFVSFTHTGPFALANVYKFFVHMYVYLSCK